MHNIYSHWGKGNCYHPQCHIKVYLKNTPTLSFSALPFPAAAVLLSHPHCSLEHQLEPVWIRMLLEIFSVFQQRVRILQHFSFSSSLLPVSRVCCAAWMETFRGFNGEGSTVAGKSLGTPGNQLLKENLESDHGYPHFFIRLYFDQFSQKGLFFQNSSLQAWVLMRPDREKRRWADRVLRIQELLLEAGEGKL